MVLLQTQLAKDRALAMEGSIDFVGQAWDLHEQTNCYPAHGASAVDGKWPLGGSVSLADCKAACQNENLCEGIVVRIGQESGGQCWLVKDVVLSECSNNPSQIYNFWHLQGEQSDASDDQATSSPTVSSAPESDQATSSPTVSSAPESGGPSPAQNNGPWELHEDTNCYDPFGATAVDGKWPLDGTVSLADCKAACEGDVVCEGIVVLQGAQDGGQCWLVKDVVLSECLDDYPPFNYWHLHRGAESAPAPTTLAELDTGWLREELGLRNPSRPLCQGAQQIPSE